MASLLSKERIVAKPGFNRWLVPPASIAIHLCIGSVYAWSIFNAPLQKAVGVVGPAADDWTLAQVKWVFSLAIVFLGLSAAVGGKWLERVGPRMVGVTAACCWGGGIVLGGLGVLWHQLWLLYAGYGVIGGCGLGLGYVSPVSTLIRWFPDRRGMATGLAIMGFGGGAIVGSFLMENLVRAYYRAPTYLGAVDAVQLKTDAGVREALVDGAWRPVVVVGPNDVAGMIRPGPQGAYLVGTGSAGVAPTLFTLGGGYFLVMCCAAFAYRVPAPGWAPAGWDPNRAGKKRAMITDRHVHIDRALLTPQFYLLWLVLCLNVTAGIGVLGVAKDLMTEIFGPALPGVVNSRVPLVDLTFAGFYVTMISVFNMVGRLAWASASDRLGRKLTYTIFFVAGMALYLSIPACAAGVSASGSVAWLVAFYAITMLIFTMYGGGFATIPAYLADIFGTRFVGGIHGRLLTAWSTAGVLGPVLITTLRDRSRAAAVRDLAARVDPAAFAAKFGAPLDQLALLVEKKTVTIAKLMELAPAGTADPSSGLYDSTMYLMAALLGVALVANLLVRPVHASHHMEDDAPAPQPKPDATPARAAPRLQPA